ncbi:MAG: hypothetical protein AB7K24_10020 [Gemmataceae bacterium]
MLRRKTVTGVFRESAALERAMAELEQSGFACSQVTLTQSPEEVPEPSPGNAETLAAQNRAGLALVGGILGLLVGLAIGFGAHGIRLDDAWSLLYPATGFFVGRLLGGWVGGYCRFGYREVEEVVRDKSLLRVAVDSDSEYANAVSILKRHGAAGPGRPLI